MPPMLRPHALLLLLGLAFLNGCAYYPTAAKHQKEDCQLFTKQLELEESQTKGNVQVQCSGKGCEAVLLASVVVPAGSFIVSGSVVLVGNAIHWMEREGTCEDGFVKQQMNNFLNLFED